MTHFTISEDKKERYFRNLNLVIHLGEMSNLLLIYLYIIYLAYLQENDRQIIG